MAPFPLQRKRCNQNARKRLTTHAFTGFNQYRRTYNDLPKFVYTYTFHHKRFNKKLRRPKANFVPINCNGQNRWRRVCKITLVFWALDYLSSSVYTMWTEICNGIVCAMRILLPHLAYVGEKHRAILIRDISCFQMPRPWDQFYLRLVRVGRR